MSLTLRPINNQHYFLFLKIRARAGLRVCTTLPLYTPDVRFCTTLCTPATCASSSIPSMVVTVLSTSKHTTCARHTWFTMWAFSLFFTPMSSIPGGCRAALNDLQERVVRATVAATGPGPSTLTTASSMGTRAALDRQIIPLPPAPTLNAAAWVSAARTQQFISSVLD